MKNTERQLMFNFFFSRFVSISSLNPPYFSLSRALSLSFSLHTLFFSSKNKITGPSTSDYNSMPSDKYRFIRSMTGE